MELPAPFGKYHLLERLAVGGMAEVFLAKSFGAAGFERLLIIKKILPHMSEDEEFITMFIDEARIASTLNHSNIIQINELGKENGDYYIAMEYCHGRDLAHTYDQLSILRRTMPIPIAVLVASRLCEGLEYAHRKEDSFGQSLQIIHRDVSPGNVLITYDGSVKIIDFGIAKAQNRMGRTTAGTLKGKFGYMSPEQVRGLPLDHRSDVFSVGILLYEMLTGERLFGAESDFGTLEKVRNASVTPPTTYNSKIPPDLERVVLKSLARDPNERYDWASDMQEDLVRFLLHEGALTSSKSLGVFLQELFAVELKRDNEKLATYRQRGYPWVDAALDENKHVDSPKNHGVPSLKRESQEMPGTSPEPQAKPGTSPKPDHDPALDGKQNLLYQATQILPDGIEAAEQVDAPAASTDKQDLLHQSTQIFPDGIKDAESIKGAAPLGDPAATDRQKLLHQSTQIFSEGITDAESMQAVAPLVDPAATDRQKLLHQSTQILSDGIAAAESIEDLNTLDDPPSAPATDDKNGLLHANTRILTAEQAEVELLDPHSPQTMTQPLPSVSDAEVQASSSPSVELNLADADPDSSSNVPDLSSEVPDLSLKLPGGDHQSTVVMHGGFQAIAEAEAASQVSKVGKNDKNDKDDKDDISSTVEFEELGDAVSLSEEATPTDDQPAGAFRSRPPSLPKKEDDEDDEEIFEVRPRSEPSDFHAKPPGAGGKVKIRTKTKSRKFKARKGPRPGRKGTGTDMAGKPILQKFKLRTRKKNHAKSATLTLLATFLGGLLIAGLAGYFLIIRPNSGPDVDLSSASNPGTTQPMEAPPAKPGTPEPTEVPPAKPAENPIAPAVDAGDEDQPGMDLSGDEPKVEVEPKVKPGTLPKVEPQVKPGTLPKVEPKVEPKVKPKPKRPNTVAKVSRPSLYITSVPRGASILINGSDKGKTPKTIRDLEIGKKYFVVISKTGYKKVIRGVKVKDNKRIKVNAKLKKKGGGASTASSKGGSGFLMANTKPWAKVIVDGKDTGLWTPIPPKKKLKLSAGKHKVTFKTKDGKTLTVQVTIKPGQTAKIIKKIE